jgi:hypothetical protein
LEIGGEIDRVAVLGEGKLVAQRAESAIIEVGNGQQAEVVVQHGCIIGSQLAPPPSARSRLKAALIRARCVNACGKFPSASPLGPVALERRCPFGRRPLPLYAKR